MHVHVIIIPIPIMTDCVFHVSQSLVAKRYISLSLSCARGVTRDGVWSILEINTAHVGKIHLHIFSLDKSFSTMSGISEELDVFRRPHFHMKQLIKDIEREVGAYSLFNQLASFYTKLFSLS